MSDFTKEELEELLMWSSYLAGCNPVLVNKIKSAIDNYCEHEYTATTDTDHSYIHANPSWGIPAIVKCRKCGSLPEVRK